MEPPAGRAGARACNLLIALATMAHYSGAEGLCSPAAHRPQVALCVISQSNMNEWITENDTGTVGIRNFAMEAWEMLFTESAWSWDKIELTSLVLQKVRELLVNPISSSRRSNWN